MLKLCDRCIHALQSRGETVLVGYSIDDSIGENCSWCEKSDTDLYMAMLNPFGHYFSGMGER